MIRILTYSLLLLAGMTASQLLHLGPWLPVLRAITMICLSYIMVEVGLEFTIDKSRLRQYGVDYWIAASAAAFPWIFCVLYFVFVLRTPWNEAGLVGQFAAPTSAGVLFTMLAAAKLESTWVFKKARVLAIFDDLQTILIMIPLQMMFVGLHWQLSVVGIIILALLVSGYQWLNALSWPTSKPWILLYGAAITVLCALLERLTSVHLDVLVPAFTLGCLVHKKTHSIQGDDPHSWLDQSVKGLFMLLVGSSLPHISFSGINAGKVFMHVLAITVLSNLGKCFPLFCYQTEASRRERLALCMAMFPRGEVGAGVLLVALSYGINGLPIVLGSLSLALNLLMTGVFIMGVAKLLKSREPR